jgi:glycolate oxidase FAD binding subunit
MSQFRPAAERDLIDIVAAAMAREEPLELVTGGSKRGYGRRVEAAHTLDLSAFAGIVLYEPEELVMTAGAATPLAEIEAALKGAGQQLAFEPPDWRHLWGANQAQSLGGVIACNLAGPRRIAAGATRDHVLGFRAVSGRGEAFKSGGRVVKNVTGYDLSKLMAGSFGTLAALMEATVKVLPAPDATHTLILRGLADERAQAAMSAALGGAFEVSGVAHLPRGRAPDRGDAMTLLRLEGHKPSVAARIEALAAALVPFGPRQQLGQEESLRLWAFVRDAMPFADLAERAIWRVSVAPDAGPKLVLALSHTLDFAHFYDWGGGLVWLAVAGADDGGAAALHAAMPKEGSHATLLRAGDALRDAVPVFEPLAPPLGALVTRVKTAFDPKRILNRGRMYRDI